MNVKSKTNPRPGAAPPARFATIQFRRRFRPGCQCKPIGANERYLFLDTVFPNGGISGSEMMNYELMLMH